VSGSLFCESRLRVLNVIDDFSREYLAAGEDTSLLGLRVSRELNRLAQIRGHPCMAVPDNGRNRPATLVLKWQEDREVEWHCIVPGKPMQTGLVEAFNGWMRDECLNKHLFDSLRHAHNLASAWRNDFNRHHSHSSLAGLTPAEYLNRSKGDRNPNGANL
jgi:putative transposase